MDNCIPNIKSDLKKRPGFKIIASFDPDVEPLVSMIEFKGRVLVATSCRVFELIDDALMPFTIYEEKITNEQKTKR